MKSRQVSEGSREGSGLAGFFPYLSLAVLCLTVLVYPTTLNPGLPLVLSGLLACVVGVGRVVLGSSKYYHASQELVLGLLLWLALSLAVHRIDLYLGLKSLYTFLGAAAFFVAPQLGILKAKQFRKALAAVFLLLVAICLGAWIEDLPNALQTGELKDFQGRFVNPDTFSVLPLAAFCLGMGLVERLQRKWVNWYCGGLGFLLLTLFATGCRAAVLGLAVGVAAFIVLVRGYRQKDIDQTRHLLIVPVVLGFFFLLFSAFSFGAVSKYASTLTYDPRVVQATRLEVNVYGWFAAAQNPILGGGPGSFGQVYQSARPPGHDRLFVDIAHNDYVEMAVEAGFPGLVGWVFLQFWVLKKLLYCVRKGKRPFMAAGLVAALLALMVFSVVNFILPERPVLWLFFLLLGLGASFPTTRHRHKEEGRLRYAAGGLLVLAGAFSIFFGAKSVWAEKLVAESGAYSRSLAKEQAFQALEKAISLQPKRSSLYLQAAELAKSLYRFSGDEQWRTRELEMLTAACRVGSRRVACWDRLSDFYRRNGDFSAAEESLGRAADLAPYRADLRRKYVALDVQRKKYDKAIERLGELVDSSGSPDYSQLRELLYLQARREPVELAKQLKAWRGQPDKSEWLNSMLGELLDKALKEERWETADLFLGEAVLYRGDDLCFKLSASKIRGARHGDKEEMEALEELLEESGPLRGECARESVVRYLELSDKLNGVEASVQFLQGQVVSFPRSSHYRLWLAKRLRRLGRLREAQKALRDGLDAGASSPELLYRLGELYEESGSKELAASYYRQTLQEKPNHAGAKAGLARVLP